jgi:hypothetical protein
MEFSDIQPVSPSVQLQPTSISTAADLSSIFNSRANAGDQIEMFLAIAEGQPETAITSFSTVVRNLTSPPIKALALQGFGKISQPYKQALALCASKESQELLKLLCNEIENRSSDLTTWAAAAALKETGFSLDNIQHPQGGNLSEPPRRIQNEILDRKIQEINRVRRLNSQGQFTAEYERFLEFWIYGPTVQFFEESFTSQRYIEIAGDILHATQVIGIQLGLNSSNKKVQKLSLDRAKDIFNQYAYANSDQGEFKGALGSSLKRFLKEGSNSDANLQALVKAFIYETPRYNMDDLRLSRLTRDQIEQEISQLESLYPQVSSIFSHAIYVSNEKIINDFLLKQKNAYIDLISSWIERLEKQIKSISVLSISQKANADLIISILDSVRNYDEALYLQISNDVHSRIQRLNSSSVKTQEEQNAVNNQLGETKQLIHSSLSSKLNGLKSEVSSLESSSSDSEETAKNMLKYGAILLAVGIFAEVIASLIAIVIVIIGILISLSFAGGGG